MGPNLESVAIRCECLPCYDWMAFASWYSFRKWLPDCSVHIELNLDKPLFRWANRLGVKITKEADTQISIPATVMILREFTGDTNIVSSKSDTQASFVDYSYGCGNFVVDKWINSTSVPFFRALKRFGTGNLTVNEMAILSAWERCGQIYQSVGGQ